VKAVVFHQTWQLQEQQLLPPDKACPFCAGTDRKIVASLQQNPDVDLLLCAKCHAASASRMPTQQVLAEYYQGYYDDRDDKVTVDTPKRIAAHIFDLACKALGDRLSVRNGVRILDYGGGDSSISISIGEKMLSSGATNVTISLIDYLAKPKATADERIVVTPFDTMDAVAADTFPLVIASAVIEHLPAPYAAINTLLGCLETGGVMYVRTPFMLPFIRLANLVGRKLDFSYPGHLHDLGAHFWNNFTANITVPGTYEIIHSRPSIVETTFKHHFLRTLLAYSLKAPGLVFGELYPLVGGWEVMVRRIA
jgi:2-polyprenyl-3-methyl-5-hydroxy-6-metoxy-1,4-benzoquinol methylase